MNKKNIKHRFGFLALLLMAVVSIGFTSCKDSEGDGYGTPVITGVRTCDPDQADSLFSKASCGQVIAIIGNNLSDVRSVYINDQSVSFNSTMNLATSLIVTIPTEKDGFKLSAFDSSLKDEIRVETSHGTATYQFKITAPGPSISRLAAVYPREAGNIMTVYGYNLVDIEKVYLTDVTGDELDTTKWDASNVPGNHVECQYEITKKDHAYNSDTQSYRTTSELQVVVPEGAPEHGALVVECAAGTVYINFNYLPGKPVIFSCSNDMPQIGEMLVLTGRDFTQINTITYGDVTLKLDEDYTVAESEDSIFIPFKKKPSAEGYNMELTVNNPAGSATVDRFYDYSTILTTFDNNDAVDNGWGPDASYIDGGSADGKYAHINVATEYQQWWGTMIYFRKDWNGNSFSLSDNIPASATADEIYFTMNVYDASDYNNGTFWGYLRYIIEPVGGSDNQYDNFGWDDYSAGIGLFPDGPVLQDINGKNNKNKWYRAVVPLSKFACYTGKTYSEIKSAGLNQFRIQSINQSSSSGKIDVKFDNIRVVYIPNK